MTGQKKIPKEIESSLLNQACPFLPLQAKNGGYEMVSEQATCNSSRSGAWSAQQKDGKIGTERHSILHTIRMGRDWPVKSVTRTESDGISKN
jgi:hypothetical protein